MSKKKKIILIPILSLVTILILFLIIMLIVDRSLSKKEYELLEKNGYINIIEVDGYNINASMFGNNDGKHVIVALAGLGCSEISVTMRKMTKALEQDNLIVFIERYGYGYSDDCLLPQTNDTIVSLYRKALKELGLNGPYILMPHSIGGAYATWWASEYPNEIEAVMFVDGSQLSDTAFDEEEEDNSLLIKPFVLNFIDFFGLDRLALRNYFYLLPDNYSKEEQELADALAIKSLCNTALVSESNLLKENAQEAYNNIVTNDIPKIYLCASWGISSEQELVDYMKWINHQKEKNNLETDGKINLSSKQIEEILKNFEDTRKTKLQPYIDKLGNCEMVLFGGDHMIYEQKPEECGRILMNFLKELD